MPKTTSTPRARKPCDQRLPDGRHAAFPCWRHGRRCGRRRPRSAVVGWVSADAQPARQRRAEAFARHDGRRPRSPAGHSAKSSPDRPVARTSTSANMPASGRWTRRPATPSSRATHQVGAAREARGHPGGDGRRPCETASCGHVGDEGLVAEQHGFGQRQQPRAELGRARRTSRTGSRARRGTWRSTRRRRSARPVAGSVEGRGEGHVRRRPVPHRPRRRRSRGHARVASSPRARDVVGAQDGAGGVVRRVQEQHPRPRRDPGGHIGGLHPEARARGAAAPGPSRRRSRRSAPS